LSLNLLLFHFTYVYANKYGFSSPLGFAFPYGKYGVELFFMLSGFVNAMTFVGKRSIKDFAFARAIRIFPSYWAVSTMPRLFGYENFEPVTWTLQIEMLFYATLIIMMMCGAFKNMLKSLMIMVTTCLLFCLSASAINSALPNSFLSRPLWIIENVCYMRNMPLFAMGMLLNEIKNKRGNIKLNIAGIIYFGVVFQAIDLRDHNPAATALLFGLLTACAWGKVPPLRFKPYHFLHAVSVPQQYRFNADLLARRNGHRPPNGSRDRHRAFHCCRDRDNPVV